MPHLHALYLWCAAHPELVLGALLFVAANVYNRLQAGPAKAALARVIDRLSALNRQGADKPLSLPLIGRSTFDAVVTPPPSQSITTTLRDVERGGSGLRGFAKLDALAWALGIGALCFAGAVLAGCPLPAPDGCTPGDTRCSREGIPQRCSSTQRWWQEPTAQSCSTFGAVCCPARSPYGNTVHACVPQRACLPEQPAAGATSTPASLAVTQ